jgi:hypothetical protein
MAARQRLAIVSDAVTPEGDEWAWEAQGILELFPDVGVVGGRILDARDRVVEGLQLFGVGGACTSAHAGQDATDAGYMQLALRVGSTSAVSSAFCVVDPGLLLRVEDRRPSWAFLGAWLGAEAARSGARVVYSPHFAGRCRGASAWAARATASEEAEFLRRHGDLVPDGRFYSPHLSIGRDVPFVPSTPEQRAASRAALFRSRSIAP